MKKLLLLLLFSQLAMGQKTYIENGKLNGILPVDQTGHVRYQLTQTLEGLTSPELFKRARKWFMANYSNEKNTMVLNDAATGELTGKGILYATGKNLTGADARYAVYHQMDLEVKDNRYRITVRDFELDYTGDVWGKMPIDKIRMGTKKLYDTLYPNINSVVDNQIVSLQKALNTPDDF